PPYGGRLPLSPYNEPPKNLSPPDRTVTAQRFSRGNHSAYLASDIVKSIFSGSGLDWLPPLSPDTQTGPPTFPRPLSLFTYNARPSAFPVCQRGQYNGRGFRILGSMT